jgi:hypothetical protein
MIDTTKKSWLKGRVMGNDYNFDSPTERRKTGRRMTERRMTERRMTEHRMTLSRKILNTG